MPQDGTHLKWMSLVSFIDSSQYRFVDSEAHCGGDQGKGQVSNNTRNFVQKLKQEFVLGPFQTHFIVFIVDT